MVSSGYMTYATFKSIWTAEIVEARFDLINVRLGGVLNFLLTRDAANDITDTRVTALLPQFCEEGLLNLMNGSKSNKFSDVWQFITTDAVRIMSRVLTQNREIVDMIYQVLGKKKIELSSVYLPSSNSKW